MADNIQIPEGKVWPSLSNMIQQSKGWNNSVKKAGWKDDSEKSRLAASFYEQWNQYLKPVYAILTPFIVIPEYISKWIYGFSYAIEKAFINMFKLFGIFDYIGQSDSFVGQVYKWLQIVGIVLFVLIALIRLLMSMAGAPFKYREFFNHMLLVTFSVSALPVFTAKFGKAIAQDTVGLAYYDVTGKQKGGEISLSITPIRANTTDLETLFIADFNTEKLGYDKETKHISREVWNDISDKNIWSKDFTSTYGSTNKAMLEFYANKDAKFSWGKVGAWFGNASSAVTSTVLSVITGNTTTRTQNEGDSAKEEDAFYGYSDIMRSALAEVRYSDGQMDFAKIDAYKTSDGISLTTALNKTYFRYKANWIAIIAQQIVLLLLLVGLLINTVKMIFKTLVTVMISPLVSYAAVGNSMRILEVWQEVMSGIAAIWFQLLNVKLAQWFLITYSEVGISLNKGASSATQKALSGKFFDGLDYFEGTIATIAVYVGVYLAASQGSKALERWLGIDTNISSGTKAGLVPLAAGAIATKMTGAKARDFVIGRPRADGTRAMSGAKRIGQNAATVGKGLKSAGEKTVAASSKAKGALVGAGVSIADNSLKNTATNMAGNTYNKVEKFAVGKYNQVSDAVKRKFDEVVAKPAVQGAKGAYEFGSKNDMTGTRTVDMGGQKVNVLTPKGDTSGVTVPGNSRDNGQAGRTSTFTQSASGGTRNHSVEKEVIQQPTNPVEKPTTPSPSKNSLNDNRFSKINTGEEGEF